MGPSYFFQVTAYMLCFVPEMLVYLEINKEIRNLLKLIYQSNCTEYVKDGATNILFHLSYTRERYSSIFPQVGSFLHTTLATGEY